MTFARGGLTARERQVLRAYCDHGTYKATALALLISEATVHRTLEAIRSKTGAANNAAAVLLTFGMSETGS